MNTCFKKAITSRGVSTSEKVVMGLTFRLSASTGVHVTSCSHVVWPQGKFHPQLRGDENKLWHLQPWPIDFFFQIGTFFYFNLKEDTAFINISNYISFLEISCDAVKIWWNCQMIWKYSKTGRSEALNQRIAVVSHMAGVISSSV